MAQDLLKKTQRSSPNASWADRQDEILDVAARLFAKHGYSDTDTQRLAEELKVGKGTLYRYFPSKEKLFLATVDRVIRKLREHIDTAIVNISNPLDRITRAIESYLAFFERDPDCVELLMQERAQFKDRKKPTYFEHREANIEPWRNLYRSLIADGRVREVPVDRILSVLSDLCYGTIFTNYFAGRRRPFIEQAQDIIDIVFFGILTDAERQRRSQPSSEQPG